MARRIRIIKAPYNHYWKGASAVTVFRESGTFTVKDEVAEVAIAKGYAIPAEEPARRPTVTRRRVSARTASDEATTNTGRSAGVDRAHLAADDSADGVGAVAASE